MATQFDHEPSARRFPAAATAMVGSLPFTDISRAIDVATSFGPDVVTIPSLPRRSPWETMLGQAAVGIRGVSLGDGGLSVDVDRLDPHVEIVTDFGHDAFATFSTFLAEAPSDVSGVKAQVTGPVTLGVALIDGGAPVDLAFQVAVRAVRLRARAMLNEIKRTLGDVTALVVLDEPSLCQASESEFPIAPDIAIDLVSGGLAAIEATALSGVHCCGPLDLGLLGASGPQVISIPVSSVEPHFVGHIAKFLEDGGTVAWGVIPTDRPLGATDQHWWRELMRTWSFLIESGCDAARLHHQALFTPACGLARHDEAQSELILRLVRTTAERVRHRARAYRAPMIG
jgi:hypothetical protein